MSYFTGGGKDLATISNVKKTSRTLPKSSISVFDTKGNIFIVKANQHVA